MPTLLQSEATECGLVAIAMVASYYGHKVDIASARRRHPQGARGTTLADVIRLGNEFSLAARALRVELNELGQLQQPAILHWNFNHFVVLRRTSRRGITIADPAVGDRTYSWQEASERFTGIAVELTPTPQFMTADDRHPNRVTRFFTWTPAVTVGLLQVLVLSLIIQALALASPFYVQLVVDDVLSSNDADLLLVLALAFAALAVLGILARWVRGLCGLYLANQLTYAAGAGVFSHLIRLPLEFFRRRHIGDIVSRFESFKPIQDFLAGSTVTLLIDGLLALSTLLLMGLYSPRLTAIVVAASLLYAIVRLIQYQPLRARNAEAISAAAGLASHFMESIRNLESLRLAGREAHREHDWRNRFVDVLSREASVSRLGLAFESAGGLISAIEYVAVIYVGAREVMAGTMTIGMMVAFMAYRSHFSSGMTSLINQAFAYRMLNLHVERLDEIISADTDPATEHGRSFRLPLTGHLGAQELSYHYTDGPGLLADISFAVPRGSSLAITGPSGTGKSTLMQILAGQILPMSGQVTIDNMRLGPATLPSYRAVTAVVTQQDQLFSGSLRDNITLFATSPDLARVRKACEAAAIADDISQLPMGFESLVGDMGTALSGGQVQRVLLARALYRQPQVLLMDEGTAHVDSDTERRIFTNLNALGITLVFVTHNPTLLEFADEVLRLGEPGQSLSTPNADRS